MLIRAPRFFGRFFGAPRTWCVVALLVLGVLATAGAYAYRIPEQAPLSRGYQPAELVGVYEIAASRPGVYLQLSADGTARIEFLELEDTGAGLRALAGAKRKAGWWWVEHPDESNPVLALFARPLLCEQFKPAQPPTCREFELDSLHGNLTVGEFGPFGRRVTDRYNRRIVRTAGSGMWGDVPAAPAIPSVIPGIDSALASPAATSPAAAPAAGGAAQSGHDSARAGTSGRQ